MARIPSTSRTCATVLGSMSVVPSPAPFRRSSPFFWSVWAGIGMPPALRTASTTWTADFRVTPSLSPFVPSYDTAPSRASMPDVEVSGPKIAKRWNPLLTDNSTPGNRCSGRKPGGRSLFISSSAALSLSIQSPELWSVTATQSTSARMKPSSQSLGVTGADVAGSGSLPSTEAGVCVWKSNFHQRAPG